jgi:hypothetical protein
VLESLHDGGVAQLGERRVRNAKVGSSILLLSTKLKSGKVHETGIIFLQQVQTYASRQSRPRAGFVVSML